jgi:hypothetical protein
MSLPSQAVVTYVAGGQVNLPRVKGSKIFVFESLDAAYGYSRGGKGQELWEVDIPDSSKKMKVRAGADKYAFDRILDFWMNKAKGNNTHGTTVPKGTLGADSIILVNRVKF